MGQFSATSGTYTSEFASVYGNAKPQIAAQLWWKANYFNPIIALKTMGLTRDVAGDYAEHYETGHQNPNWIVGRVVAPAGAPNAPLVVTVAPVDIAADNTVFAQVGVSVRLAGGREAYVSNVQLVGGEWQVTLLPWNATWQLSASTGDSMWTIGQTSLEGSQTPNTQTNQPMEKVRYPLEIVRNNENITGSGELTELWTNTDQFGNNINPPTLETLTLEMRQTTQLSNKVFFGYPNQNATSLAGYRKMYGMDYTISNGGYTHLYPTGLFTLNDLATMSRVMMKRNSGNEIFFFGGPDFQFAAQQGLPSVFSQNPIVFKTNAGSSPYASKFVSNQDELQDQFGIAMNIRYVNWGGVHFNWCACQQFGQNQTGGGTGHNESGYAFGIPMTKAANAKGVMQDRFKLTYRKQNGKSREMVLWSHGGAAPQNKNGYDGQVLEALSEMGTEYNGIENFIICKPF